MLRPFASGQGTADLLPGRRAPQRGALVDLVHAMAMVDPERAEAIARSIEDASWQSSALTWIAVAVAASDPERAEAVAYSIETEHVRITTLAKISFLLAQHLWLSSFFIGKANTVWRTSASKPSQAVILPGTTGHPVHARPQIDSLCM